MTSSAALAPIFHLSLPVSDLEEALAYYTQALGGVAGRREDAWADVALFGAQLTLQHVPEDVLRSTPRSCHFGAALDWESWERLIGKLTGFVEPPRVGYEGTEREQAKAMIADPSGNLIEIKAYRNPRAVLGPLVREYAA